MLMVRAALYLSFLPLVLGNVKLGKHIVKYTEATCLQATRVLCPCFPRVVPDESRNFMKLYTFWGEFFLSLVRWVEGISSDVVSKSGSLNWTFFFMYIYFGPAVNSDAPLFRHWKSQTGVSRYHKARKNRTLSYALNPWMSFDISGIPHAFHQHTPEKTNMEPENGLLEKGKPSTQTIYTSIRSPFRVENACPWYLKLRSRPT